MARHSRLLGGLVAAAVVLALSVSCASGPRAAGSDSTPAKSKSEVKLADSYFPASPTSDLVADHLTEALGHYFDGEFDEGIAVASDELLQHGLTARDSVAIYSVLGFLNFAKGRPFHEKAYGYLQKIIDIGPCLIDLPEKFWHEQYSDEWCKLASSEGVLACPHEDHPHLETIAFSDFGCSGLPQYMEELQDIVPGLKFWVNVEFEKVSGLRVVERSAVDQILSEVQLVKQGLIDPDTAIQVGKLLGCQIIVFGHLSRFSKKECRMGLRAIRVETGEQIEVADLTGRCDYFKMETEILKDLAKKLNYDPDQIDASTPEEAAAMLYSRGIHYMQMYDYDKAYEYFKKAFDQDPSFTDAKRRMQLYAPIVKKS